MVKLLDYSQPINWADPLNRGLVSRWQAVPWYSSGPRMIDLGGRYPATLTGGPTWDGARGRQGGTGSVRFDGTNDCASVSNSSAWAVATITISAWVRSTGSGTRPFCSKDNLGTSQRCWQFRQGSTDKLEFIPFNASTFGLATGTTSLNTGAWLHVAGAWDGTTIRVYVNGTEEGSASLSGSLRSGTNAVFLGTDETAAPTFLAGSLDDVRIWSRALSASEVKSLYEDSRAGSPRTLNWVRPGRFAFSLGGILYREQWCAGLDRHWVGGLT